MGSGCNGAPSAAVDTELWLGEGMPVVIDSLVFAEGTGFDGFPHVQCSTNIVHKQTPGGSFGLNTSCSSRQAAGDIRNVRFV